MTFLKEGGVVLIGGELIQFVDAICPYYEKIFTGASVGESIGTIFMNSKIVPRGGEIPKSTKHNTVLYGDSTLKIKKMW